MQQYEYEVSRIVHTFLENTRGQDVFKLPVLNLNGDIENVCLQNISTKQKSETIISPQNTEMHDISKRYLKIQYHFRNYWKTTMARAKYEKN